MKKIFTFCCIALLSGCAALNYQVSLGSTEEDFKRGTLNEALYELTPERTIYSVDIGNGTKRLVYFEKGKLTRVETIERTPDLYIKHEKSLTGEASKEPESKH
ncbi:hypothetical protein [Sabulibacter ruber]|uniref:hypothetical protein n=1 Tax=Sabulibacter ruber TaxID=2811901 RepID=UPI001A97831D|nr:hypothetical protein [Sabulibacter ruber]